MTPERRRLAEYLLGNASAEEAAGITEQLFEDESLPVEMEEAERDLVDGYAKGELSKEDALALESAALRSPGLSEKMRFARALARTRRPSGVSRYWLTAAAGLAILSSAGILWLMSTNSRLQSELASVRAHTQQPERLERQSSMAFMITPLERGASSGIRLAIGNPAALVRLNFAIEMLPGAMADIRIRTQAGALVLEQRQVTPAGSVLGVWMNAKDLPPGGYTAEIVERDGREADYSFEVAWPAKH